MVEHKDIKSLDPYGIVKLLNELVLNYISLDFLLDKPEIFLCFKRSFVTCSQKIIPRQFRCQHLRIKRFHVTVCITSVS